MSTASDHLPALTEAFLTKLSQRYAMPTVVAFSQGLELFLQHLRGTYKVRPSALVASDLQLGWGESFIQWLQETRSVETEHLYTRSLIQFFEYLNSHTQAQFDLTAFTNFVESHRRPKVHTIPTIPSVALETIVRYAENASPQPTISEREHLGQLRDRAFILTLAYSGLRISEICDLRRSQFDTRQSQLKLSDEIHLPLPRSAVAAVSAYLTARSKLDNLQTTVIQQNQLPLFARHDKRVAARILPISRWTGANIVEAWVQLALTPEERSQLETSGQTITPHTFRHYFVLNALSSTDQDVAAVQNLARHGDRSTTRRYLHKLQRDTNS